MSESPSVGELETPIIPLACLLLLVLLQSQANRRHTLLIQRVIQYKGVIGRSKYRTQSAKIIFGMGVKLPLKAKIKSLINKTSYKTHPVVT